MADDTNVVIKAAAIEKSPWFNIKLFRTQVKFRLPKPSAKTPVNELGQKVDQRPFINTAAKANYEINEELGRCLTNIYNTAWKIQRSGFFKSSVGKLEVRFFALGVTKSDRLVYNDLYNPEIAVVYIRNYYSSAYQALALDGLDFTHEQINNNTAFFVRSQNSQLDCFIPFSNLDLLLFSFRMKIKKGVVAEQLEGLHSAVETFVSPMLESLIMESAL